MADSIRERLLQAVVTKLQEIDEVTVYRSRTAAISRAKTPAIIVTPVSESVEYRLNFVRLGFLELQIELLTREKLNDLSADQVADPIIQAIVTKMTADIRWGGLAINTEEVESNFDFENADADALSISMTWRITSQTLYNDLTTLA